jgi:hypothetical protein
MQINRCAGHSRKIFRMSVPIRPYLRLYKHTSSDTESIGCQMRIDR